MKRTTRVRTHLSPARELAAVHGGGGGSGGGAFGRSQLEGELATTVDGTGGGTSTPPARIP